MPIYEYECSLCGRFEAVQKVSDKPLTAQIGCSRDGCPQSAERLISAAAFHLKGSGWYKTDYTGSNAGGKDESGSKQDKTDAGSCTEPAKEAAKSDTTNGDTKTTTSVEKKEPKKEKTPAAG